MCIGLFLLRGRTGLVEGTDWRWTSRVMGLAFHYPECAVSGLLPKRPSAAALFRWTSLCGDGVARPYMTCMRILQPGSMANQTRFNGLHKRALTEHDVGPNNYLFIYLCRPR